MRSRNGSSGLRVGVISQLVPSVLGVHSPFKSNMPFGTSMKARRIGRFVSAAKAGVIASSMGRAIAAPAPRKNVRRGMYFLDITIFGSPHLEGSAVYDAKNNGRPGLVVGGSVTRDFANDGTVILFNAAAERVGQEPLSEIFNEHIALLDQHLAQAVRSVERSAIGQGTGGIDLCRSGSRVVAPFSDAIEIVQREAERVRHPVAGRTLRTGAVQFHALAHGQLLRGLIVLQRWHIRWRWWWRCAQQLFQDPFAANGRGRTVGIGGYGEDTRLSKQAKAFRIVQLNAAEFVPVNSLDSIVLSHALIEKRVVGAQQIDDTVVLPHLAFDQKLGFLLHRLTQIFVKRHKGRRIGRYPVDVAQEEPLANEALDQRLRAGIRHHALDLRPQDSRVVQLSLLGNGEQLRVRNAAPEEE